MSSEIAIADEPAPTSVRGRRIAHYEIQARIGEGGMGVVYRALDTKLRRSVALKVLHPNVAQDEDRRRRFIREGRLVAHLTHPNIATVYDVGEADGRVFIAMELVEGDPLTAMIQPGRHVSVIEALRVIHEVARGLAKAHEIGVIHRDLKPDNIMVGDDGIVKILDFGVAKRLDSFKIDFTDIKTQHGSLVGTPAYMSPEQAAGKKEVDQRSDIFSVGVVLFELLTGKRPFDGETWQETIIAINRDDPPPVSKLRADAPSALDDIVDACLAKEPDCRYGTCRELLDDIEAALMTLSTGTFPPGGASGILARASSVSSAPPPPSGEMVRPNPVPNEPTTADCTAEPMARSMAAEMAPAPSRRGVLVGGALAAALIVGVVAYASSGDGGPETTASQVADPAGEAPAVEGEEPTPEAPIAEDSHEQTGSEQVEASGPDEPIDEGRDTDGDAPEPTAAPSTTAPGPLPRPVPTPLATPKPPPPKPPAPAPARPKNPVLGF